MPTALAVGTNTYVSLEDASAFLDDSASGAPWAELDEDTQNRCLLTATRLLERQCWNGTKTDPVQVMQHPREGLVNKNGEAVDSSTVAQEVIDAECELAFLISQDADQETAGGIGNNISSVGAGSAKVSFFRPTGGAGGVGSQRFPPIVFELIGQFMCGFGGGSPPFITGTDVVSSFSDEQGFGLSDPL